MKIVFLGASLTEGVYGGNFVKGVAERLPQHEIINEGVSGNTINRMLTRLDSILEQQPDAIFVLAGSNDAIAYSQPETRSYYKSAQKLPNGFLTVEEFGAMYREMLQRMQLAYVRPLIGLVPLEHNPGLAASSTLFNQETVEAARAYNAPVLDLVPHLLPDQIPERPLLGISTILQIGERMQSGWKDYETERQEGGFTYTFDGTHFTPETADKVAGIIATWLDEQLS